MLTIKRKLQQDEIIRLAQTDEQWCVTIYLPTFRNGHKRKENPVRLKSAVHATKQELEARGVEPGLFQSLWRECQALTEDTVFWNEVEDGLALLSTPAGTKIFLTSEKFDEDIVVDHRFDLVPLLRIVQSGLHFYLLALDQNRTRLFAGTRHELTPVDTGGLPSARDRMLSGEVFEKERMRGRSLPGMQGVSPGTFHGRGPRVDAEEKDMLRYLREVDTRVYELLHDSHRPLLVAGTAQVVGLYRQANTYPYLSADTIPHDPHGNDLHRLHKEAVARLEAQARVRLERAVHRYLSVRGRLGREGAAEELEKIVPAALAGKIDTLLLHEGVHVWGAITNGNGELELHDRPGPEDHEILSLLVAHTLRHRGQFRVLAPSQLPQSPVAAVLRK